MCTQVEEHEAGDVVEVAVQQLQWEAVFITNLANDSFVIELLLEAAAVAVVDLFLGDFLQPVAGKVKACVATITVEHLVGVIVETAEADLAVRLKHLLVVGKHILGGSHQLLVLNEGVEHLHSLIGMAVLEVLEDGHPHQVLFDLADLLLRSREVLDLLLDLFKQVIPILLVGLVGHF